MDQAQKMIRYGVHGLVAFFALVILSAFAQAQKVQLNTLIEVDAEYITLGDIFSPLSNGADHVIAAAPKPGESLVLDQKTLRRIARSFKLEWLPRAGVSEASIYRQGTAVAQDKIILALQKAIVASENLKARKGQKWVVKIDRAQDKYFVPVNALPKVAVQNLRYDQISHRFQADIALYEGGNNTRVRGEFFAVIALPVPIHSIAADENITQRDLHFIEVRKDKVSPNVQTDVTKIVGKSSKRLLRADAPIAIQYLQEPMLVKRNGLVSVVYAVKNLTLVTKGVALSDGSMGQIVRIKNLKSQRVVDSIVTGDDEVSVSFTGSAENG